MPRNFSMLFDGGSLVPNISSYKRPAAANLRVESAWMRACSISLSPLDPPGIPAEYTRTPASPIHNSSVAVSAHNRTASCVTDTPGSRQRAIAIPMGISSRPESCTKDKQWLSTVNRPWDRNTSDARWRRATMCGFCNQSRTLNAVPASDKELLPSRSSGYTQKSKAKPFATTETAAKRLLRQQGVLDREFAGEPGDRNRDVFDPINNVHPFGAASLRCS